MFMDFMLLGIDWSELLLSGLGAVGFVRNLVLSGLLAYARDGPLPIKRVVSLWQR